MSNSGHSGIRRLFTPNIGTIVFGILFIYIIISVLIYATTNHVRSYQVTSGPLARNSYYTGIALYDETLVTADASGYVDYYARNNAKIRKGGVVYGISPDEVEKVAEAPDAETLRTIRRDISKFSQTFSTTDFHDIYSLKYQVEGDIISKQLQTISNSGSSALTLGNETISVSPAAGIISFTTDGCESMDEGDITADLFDSKYYEIQNLRTGDKINAGDPVYRLIKSENWSLLIPLTAKQIVKLNNIGNVKVKFLKDGITQKAGFTILTMEDGSYVGRLTFTNGLIRYLDSRYVDIELVTNTEVGLKIPVSAIVTKTFFTIPDEYATYGGNTKNVGFMKSTTDKDGNATAVFIAPTIYDHSGGKYYVDPATFSQGDIILRDGSTDRYIIRDTAELEGVYSMNKGYAVFRHISILDKNEDYCIVAKGTSYGIAQFDNIVEDASAVKESQITAQ